MNKKIIIAAGMVVCALGAFAGPHGGRGPGGHGGGGHGPGGRPAPAPHHAAPHHHGGGWGRGGCNFWPGFVGGVIGGAVARTVVEPAPVVVAAPVVTTPAVVTTPVTTTQNVWVEGRYVDQVQANGTVVRVWQPGHYEVRTVVTQTF